MDPAALVADRNRQIRLHARLESSLERENATLAALPDTTPEPYEVRRDRALAIRTRGLHVAEPADEDFVRRTLVLVAQAGRDARRLMLDIDSPGAHPHGPKRRLKGRCVGCGCPNDDRTPGCHNCHSRHSARTVAGRPLAAVASAA